jgi:hypothetical protein
MSRTTGISNPQYQFLDEKNSPIPVLLIDSDGTIFYGNMKKIISEVIRFLKKSPEERNSVDEFCQKLSAYDLSAETMEFLQLWLKKHEDLYIPFDIRDEELYQIQQPIAESFRLIKSEDGLTALDVFKMVKEKNGIVMILTFNTYAPLTIRQALIKNGLSIAEASEIKIIYPTPRVTACPEDGIYTCPLPQGDRTIDKNTFIEEAQRIGREEFKLTHCEYFFADDEHARVAQLKFSDIRVVTGEYASGQHLEILKKYIKNDVDHESKQCHQDLDNSSGSDASIFDIAGESPTLELRSLNLSTRRLSKGDDSTLVKAGSPRKMSIELSLFSQNITPVETKKFGQSINFFSLETLPLVNSGSKTLSGSLIGSSSAESIEKSTPPESPGSGQSNSPLTRDLSRNQLSQSSPKTSEENLGLSNSNSMTTLPLIGQRSLSNPSTVNSAATQNPEKQCCCLIL